RRRHTRSYGDWSSDVCSSDLRERFVDVKWDPRVSGLFPVSIGVEALDRPKLLRDISTAISEFGVNISQVSSSTLNGIAHFRFTRSEERRVGKEWSSWRSQ